MLLAALALAPRRASPAGPARRGCGSRSRSSRSTSRSPAPVRRSSARASWARPGSSPRWPAARRRAGTRCCSRPRSRSSLNPRAADDPGWQLSFAAVLAMLALVPRRCATRLARRGRAARRWPRRSRVTVAATLGTAPLHRAPLRARSSLVSLPANLLAVPAVAPVMWLGMIARRARPGRAPALAAPRQRRWPRCRSPTWPGWPTPRRRCRARESPRRRRAPPGVAGARVGAGRRSPLARAAPPPARRRRRAGAAPALAVARGRRAAAAGPRARRGRRAPDVSVPRRRPGRRHADPARRRRGPRRHRPAGRPGRSRACARPGSGGSTCSSSPTPRPTTTAPRPRCCARCRVGLVLDGGRRRHADAAAHARPRPRRAACGGSSRDAGQVLRAGPLELRVLWPRRAPAAAPAPSPTCAPSWHVRAGDFDLLLAADAESDVLAGPRPARRSRCSRSSHHGSDDPGLPGVLRAPAAAAPPSIEVGRRNRYGHPTPVDARRAARRGRRACAAPTATAPSALTAVRTARHARRRPAPRLAAVPDFKPAYLIHGDDHGRISERRAALRALAERESGSGGVECFEGDAVDARRRRGARSPR